MFGCVSSWVCINSVLMQMMLYSFEACFERVSLSQIWVGLLGKGLLSFVGGKRSFRGKERGGKECAKETCVCRFTVSLLCLVVIVHVLVSVGGLRFCSFSLRVDEKSAGFLPIMYL